MVAFGDGTPETRLDDRASFCAVAGDFAGTIRGHVAAGVQRFQRKTLSAIQAGRLSGGLRHFLPAKGLRKAVVAAAWPRWAGAVDCLRESGELDAGAGKYARKRDWRALGPGSGTRKAHPPTAGGKPAARAYGRGARSGAGSEPEPGPGGVSKYATRSAVRGFRNGLADARVHHRARGADMHSVWSSAGATRRSGVPRSSAEGRHARHDRGTLALRAQTNLSRVPDRAFPGAARGSAAFRPELEQSSRAGRRLSAKRHSGGVY